MDLVAKALWEKLQAGHAHEIDAVMIRPAFRRRFTKIKAMRSSGVMFNADRILNRFIDYPRTLKRRRNQFDIFHVTDHSYSHLLHYLPNVRTIVTCHDVDSYRSILEPELEPRSWPFRMMTRRIVDGLRRAAGVACVSEATRQQLLRFRLVPEERTITILNGVDAIFTPASEISGDSEAARLLGPVLPDAVEILHVGSTIPRKRIDVLLRVFARIRERFGDVRLIRVGGAFTASQTALLQQLGLEQAATVLPFIASGTLAALYRRAALVLVTSEAEGFGLPVVEAMACGATVVASDIPALREVGGEAALFAEVGDIEAMAALAIGVLQNRGAADAAEASQRRERSLVNAARFSWTEHARSYAALYRRVAEASN
jgi:glycosyltransferase involved in cell wall biosynthesis